MRQMRTRGYGWLVVAVAALTGAVPLSERTLLAQYPVGSDGRALDANNRIGSGGMNDLGRQQPQVTGNDIVYGNVTAGRQFRGNVPYTDPRAFRGPVSGVQVDRFVGQSAGVPQPNAAPSDLTQPMPYYGRSRQVPPPPGFVREGFSGGYVPAASPSLTPVPEDTRLGGPVGPPSVALPRPGMFLLPGPLDVSGNPTLMSASPLYGVQPMPQMPYMPSYGNLRPQPGAAAGATDSQVGQMRQDLQGTMVPQGPQSDAQAAPASAGEATQGQSLAQPLESGQTGSVAPNALGSGLQSNPLTNAINTQQSLRNRVLTPGAPQSSQQGELQRRLGQQYGQAQITDQEANRRFQAELRAQQAQQGQVRTGLEVPAVPGVPDQLPQAQQQPPGDQRPAQTPADATGVAGAGAGARPQPLQVRSLADGVKSPQFAQILRDAEQLMKEGKYTSAIDQYNRAAGLAPNNKLVVLGRAHAELGAGYYTRAEADLYDALTSDPALLMGQYDLRGWLGAQRLDRLVSDLKELARTQPQQAQAPFLLAYIAYNTGSESAAAGYLDMAEKRGGDIAPLYRVLRSHWTLPTTGETSNK